MFVLVLCRFPFFPELLALLESTSAMLLSGAPFPPALPSNISSLHAALKAGGGILLDAPSHAHARARVDAAMDAVRGACKDPKLDKVARLHLLELVELRAMEWKANENVENYYKHKHKQLEMEAAGTAEPQAKAKAAFQRSQSLNVNAPEFSPPSSEASQRPPPPPTRRAMSWKEDVVIRNADSGRGEGGRF